MAVAALVLAAGRGERLGGALPKAFLPVAGKSMLLRSLEAMEAVGEVGLVVPVVAGSELARFRGLGTGHLAKLAPPVPGGVERQDSVRAGVAALPEGVAWVAVHDAARCLVRPADVSRAIAGARETGAAILAHPARDTIKRVREAAVVETPPRAECWIAQTPQVFRVELLREALEKAEAEGTRATDDAQLVERLGVKVRVVEGDPRNWKITRPEDLTAAEAWLRGEG